MLACLKYQQLVSVVQIWIKCTQCDSCVEVVGMMNEEFVAIRFHFIIQDSRLKIIDTTQNRGEHAKGVRSDASATFVRHC